MRKGVAPRFCLGAGVATVLLAFGLTLSACGSSTTATTTTTQKTTTTTSTVPVTTTTATSSGGFVAQTDCPYYPLESDGYGGVQENGVDLFFTVNAPPQSIWTMCQTQLKGLGWKIIKSGTSYAASGSTVQATAPGAFAQINIGSDPSVPRVSVCTWTQKPADTSCPYGA
jgi:hypothetical protein